jgi:hypothetical protein
LTGSAGLKVLHPNAVGANLFKPRFLPENQAGGLAAPIGLTVASQVEMNTIGESAASNGVDCIAGLMCALENLESLSAVLEHLRHEGKSLQATEFVKSTQNLFLTADFYPITSAKPCHLCT